MFKFDMNYLEKGVFNQRNHYLLVVTRKAFIPSKMSKTCVPMLLTIVVCILLNASVTECLSAWPHKTIMRKVATLSTAFLLSGSTMVSADNARTVGEITTSGIVFKDTLKITGEVFSASCD